MRVIKTDLVRDIIRTQRAAAQHFLGPVDPGRRKIFFKCLAGALAEYHTEMAGTEIHLGGDFKEG